MNWTRELERLVENLPHEQKNIRTLDALEKLVSNLDRIKIEDIEALTFIPVAKLPTVYNYDIFIDETWIPIEDEMIPNMERVPGLIERGLMRKHVKVRKNDKRI